MDQPLTESERVPLLTDAGRAQLHWLREHEQAPRYNRQCGDRLTADGLERVRTYGEAVRSAPRGWQPGQPPEWVRQFVESALADVPYYRRYDPAEELALLPTVRRDDLMREPWSFVPDSQSLDDLILYHSSQTTGDRVTVLSHPEVPARDLPLLEYLLEREGVSLQSGAGRVAIVMVCAQTHTITYPTVLSYLGEAGYAKINLNPKDWRNSEDRRRFLDDCDPDLYSGDPIAFHELMQLPLRTRPRALISTAMTLLPGFRRVLEAHFGCPVLDLYALNETGIIAADRGGGMEVVPHDVYVEVLHPDGSPCADGERGEITVTGGNNPFFPLLRYRTGDYARLDFSEPLPRLLEFEPREPVVFSAPNGAAIPAHAITAALADLPIAAFTLRQGLDGGFTLRVRGEAPRDGAPWHELDCILGDALLSIEELQSPYDWGGKIVQYATTPVGAM